MSRFTIITALAMVALAGVAQAEQFPARVVGIADGDTITVLTTDHEQRRIRLAGIDAPEKKQPFGQRSKQHLSDLVFGRDVVLDCGKTDRYGRRICVVLIDGQDANLAQVEAGLAWWYRQYAREQTAQQRADYEAAETNARADKRGLWSDPSSTPPWEWRHR